MLFSGLLTLPVSKKVWDYFIDMYFFIHLKSTRLSCLPTKPWLDAPRGKKKKKKKASIYFEQN